MRDDNANAICAQLLLLAAEDPHKDIWLYINSPGGSVTAGMAIFDTMQWVPNDVATVAMGLAASMGQFLLSAGAAGKRYATPHARVMMHQPSGGIGGTASDIKIQAQQMLHRARHVPAALVARTAALGHAQLGPELLLVHAKFSTNFPGVNLIVCFHVVILSRQLSWV